MLTPHGPASYRCVKLSTLGRILIQNGYQEIPTTSPYQVMRYQWMCSIVVLYHNGTVLLQGSDLNTPRWLFAKLFEAEQHALPF